jgi:isoquinoline 1-oxidoreductase subunit beta
VIPLACFPQDQAKRGIPAAAAVDEIAIVGVLGPRSLRGLPMTNRDIDVPFHLSFPTYVAAIRHVVVGEDRQITILLVDVALDCGLAIDPENVTMGIGNVLHSTIAVDQGPVEQSQFGDYLLSWQDITLEAHTHIVESSAPPGSAGEPGVSSIAAASCNAAYATAAIRIRALLVEPVS